MQDLNPTQYGEADAGGRRHAERLLVREKHGRFWLSEIICGVLFDETVCEADTPAPRRAVASPTRGGHTSELSVAHCQRSSGFVICCSVETILSQGNRYADDDH
jgi:hypothetical protein